MNALHLIWIIPVVAIFGYIICALMSANSDDDRCVKTTQGVAGNLDGKFVYNVVPYPMDGMIYYVESSEGSDESWIANKPIQYIDQEGYHCGWGIATLCFKFKDMNDLYFFSREEAKVNLENKEKWL
jgi:hypothetical protein